MCRRGQWGCAVCGEPSAPGAVVIDVYTDDIGVDCGEPAEGDGWVYDGSLKLMETEAGIVGDPIGGFGFAGLGGVSPDMLAQEGSEEPYEVGCISEVRGIPQKLVDGEGVGRCVMGNVCRRWSHWAAPGDVVSLALCGQNLRCLVVRVSGEYRGGRGYFLTGLQGSSVLGICISTLHLYFQSEVQK